MTLRDTSKWFWHGQGIYFAHVIALMAPGVEATQYEAHPIEPKSLDGWSSWDRAFMIEEGRRQAGRQLTDLKEVRGRAQWLFTVGIAVTAAIGGALHADRPNDIRLVLFIASLLMLICGLAGAAGIMTVRADFNTIDTAVLSHKPRPTERYLAGAYSRMLRDGENTVATRITIFRQAVLWIIAGGYVGLVATLI